MTPATPTPAGGLTRRTPEEAPLAIAGSRAGVAGARALALLVDRLATVGLTHDLEGARGTPVRDALRQLVARTRNASLVIHVHDAGMIVDGTLVARGQVDEDPLLQSLQQRLRRRDIGMLSVRDGAAPGELLSLARAMVSNTTRGSDAVSSAGGAARSGERGGADMPTGAGMLTPSEAVALDDGAAPPASREVLRSWSVLVLRPAAPGDVTTDEALRAGSFARLATARTDAAASQAVADLADDIPSLVARGDAHGVERVARAFANAIESVGSGAGRLALEGGLRQLLTPAAIVLLASRIPETTDRGALLSVFARAGEVGVRALADGLMSAPDATARRAYFDAIVAMDVGGALLRDALDDERWYVVRNTAALLGEMGVAEADRPLIRLLDHEDARIRIAGARALIRLRTARALAALHAAVDDPHPEVRRIAAMSYGVAMSTAGVARPTAGRLAAALEREQDEDVALEMMAAMGRLGSADAVQRLLRIVQSPTVDTPAAVGAEERGYAPHASWVRVAALEALVEARGVAVAATVNALVNDADPAVADAAFRLRNTA